jgi:hypothetical protein
MQAIDFNPETLTQPIQDTLRVCALHAFAYCPRLFYLEEVEELYTQDAATPLLSHADPTETWGTSRLFKPKMLEFST